MIMSRASEEARNGVSGILIQTDDVDSVFLQNLSIDNLAENGFVFGTGCSCGVYLKETRLRASKKR